MKVFLSFFLLHAFILNAGAQNEREAQPDNINSSIAPVTSNTIYGRLVDKTTGKGIESASVQLFNGADKKGNTPIDGMLTKPNGDFRLERLPMANSYTLVITALGYSSYRQTINFDHPRESNGFFSKDVGNISLSGSIKQLDNVVITSAKPALTMGIDRKIFDVSKSLLATGGTAVDIMKNIPSVSVDIEGNVQLRSNPPQIFVDGRPTILTLDQIPADHIDKIELITNPSAKYDAASAGGIINIVLKKNKRVGFNGVLSLSGGTPSLFSSNLNVNLRQGKFNFFASGGHNESGGKAKGRTLRQNKTEGITTDYFNQYSENNRHRNFNSIRFGTDVFLDNRNTITISQDFVRGRFSNQETQEQEYLDKSQVLQRYGDRTTNGQFAFDRKSTRLNFKHNFPKDGMEWTADASYNQGNRSSNSNILNLYFNADGSEFQSPALVSNDGNSNEKQFTFQTDFSNPVNDHVKIETGLRSFQNDFLSYYNAYSNSTGEPIKLPLSNNYRYKEYIHAAYFTYSYKKEKFSYQLGLRAEYSKFSGELVDSAYKFGYEYPAKLGDIWNGLFPSLFITKNITEKDELQFNYSRRIRRPRFWELNPFIDINDPANLRQGNPQLQPEFINSFELNYNRKYKDGNLLAVLYFTNNPKDITQYSDTITAEQYSQLNNAAIDPNAILNTFINASTTNRYGAEFTLQHKAGKNFDITPTVNLQYRKVNANVNGLNLSNKGFNWEGKLIVNYKIETRLPSLWNNLGFQLIADYESPRVIPQGKSIAEFDVDFALKKEFLKNKKGSLTFAINDVFNTRRWGNIYDTDKFYQDAYYRWNVRSFRLTFSYKFGDSNFSLFKKGGGGGREDE